jgi:hypothetical protein
MPEKEAVLKLHRGWINALRWDEDELSFPPARGRPALDETAAADGGAAAARRIRLPSITNTPGGWAKVAATSRSVPLNWSPSFAAPSEIRTAFGALGPTANASLAIAATPRGRT